MRVVLQFLLPAQSVLLQLDEDAGFPPPGQVDELPVLGAEDDPEIRREIPFLIGRSACASVSAAAAGAAALTWTASPRT